jgi:probable rRNA maturation factor
MKPTAKTPVLFNNGTDHEVPSLEQLIKWVELVSELYGSFIQVSIEIVDSQTSRKLNKTYRNKDSATNVLSFPLELPEVVAEDLIGDLAICAELVRDEALQQNKAINDHWAHLILHGTLHLLGYDHIEDKDANIMEALEVKLLDSIGIANPYGQ